MKLKTIQLSPVIAKHDLDVKINNARRLINKGNKIKLSLKFQGRQIIHQALGHNIIHSVLNVLSDIAIIESPPKLEGNQILAIITPKRGVLDKIKRAKKEN